MILFVDGGRLRRACDGSRDSEPLIIAWRNRRPYLVAAVRALLPAEADADVDEHERDACDGAVRLACEVLEIRAGVVGYEKEDGPDAGSCGERARTGRGGGRTCKERHFR